MSQQVESHTLSPQALDQVDGLMAFNWLPAGYAHGDWLGPWADLMGPRHLTSVRLLRRVSMVLLDRHGLRQRYIRSTNETSNLRWLFASQQQTNQIAEELGVAMLGGWVRHSLERLAVAQQLRVLGQERRARALTYATELRALPYTLQAETWPVALSESMGVLELGASCMAALLRDELSGAKERFVMRFAQGSVVPLSLELPQQQEAHGLIQRLLFAQQVHV